MARRSTEVKLPAPAGAGWLKPGALVQIAFALFAVCLLIFFGASEQVRTLSITFVSIVLEAFPFMLVGTLIGGFIEVFVSRERIAKLMPKGSWLAIFVGAGLGFVLPVCECAIVPVVRRLLAKGVPLGAAIAFLLGGPIFNPVVAASTAVAYSFVWEIVATRLVLGFMIAVTIGILMDLFFSRESAILQQPDTKHECGCGHEHCDHDHSHEAEAPFFAKVGRAISHAADDFFDIGRFLVIGAFIAAVLQSVVARQAFFELIAGTPLFSILLMMGLAVVLNLCSEADAFVAASFRSTLLPLSAQMGFMVLGPMLDVKLLIMYTRVFRKRAIVALALMVFAVVLLSMLTLDATLP